MRLKVLEAAGLAMLIVMDMTSYICGGRKWFAKMSTAGKKLETS